MVFVCRSLLRDTLIFPFFVGQCECEVFVCLGFGHFILFVYFFPWPRSSKGLRMGRQFFKNVDFSVTYHLKGFRSLLEIVFCRTV